MSLRSNGIFSITEKELEQWNDDCSCSCGSGLDSENDNKCPVCRDGKKVLHGCII